MNRPVPVHIVILDRIQNTIADRLNAHRVKTGKGLVDQEYQRHVGRIAELELLAKEMNDLRTQLRLDDDLEDERDERQKKRRSR